LSELAPASACAATEAPERVRPPVGTRDNSRELRVTFLTIMPSPYIQDLFAAMQSDGRIEPQALYLETSAPCTYWQEAALPGYARVLPGRWYGISGARLHWNGGVISALRESRSDVFVIGGYAGLTQQAAMRWLNRSRRPWVFWGEVPGFERRGTLGRGIRRIAQRPVRKADAVAAIGARAAAAYRELCGPGMPVVDLPYVCELEPFQRARRTPTSGEVRLLYCGQLVERKGVDVLIRAFCRLAQTRTNVRLTLLGTGQWEGYLKQLVSPDCRARVEFAGFHETETLPRKFAEADVFVLPSRHDGWGVVVNQALGAGLPVIVSDRVGASDLVHEGENGFVVPAEDEVALEQALRRLVDEPRLIVEFGRRSRELAGCIDVQTSVEGWVRLLREVHGAAQRD
jgi:glycosyltransferase involved in cell wall biosynthesis